VTDAIGKPSRKHAPPSAGMAPRLTELALVGKKTGISRRGIRSAGGGDASTDCRACPWTTGPGRTGWAPPRPRRGAASGQRTGLDRAGRGCVQAHGACAPAGGGERTDSDRWETPGWDAMAVQSGQLILLRAEHGLDFGDLVAQEGQGGSVPIGMTGQGLLADGPDPAHGIVADPAHGRQSGHRGPDRIGIRDGPSTVSRPGRPGSGFPDPGAA